MLGVKARHQSRRHADHQTGADPLQNPEEEEPAISRSGGTQQQRTDTPQQPGTKHAAVPVDIADAAKGEQQASVSQHVGDDDPLDHHDRQTKALGDVGKGDVDGGIERHPGGTQPDRDQLPPFSSRHWAGAGNGVATRGPTVDESAGLKPLPGRPATPPRADRVPTERRR